MSLLDVLETQRYLEQIALERGLYCYEYAKSLESRIKELEAENKRIRNEALEEAAKIVEDHYWDSLEYKGVGEKHGKSIMGMIRALKTTDGKEKSE